MGKIICLDAGHGGKDSGAILSSRFEKNDTLRMVFAIKAELIKQGFTVILTRDSDEYVSLQERSNFANQKKADYFISIHRNAFSLAIANGVENWIYERTDAQTQKAAELILNEVVGVGVQSNRGVKRGNFHVTRETTMPACLLELNFISNPKDNELFDKNFEGYAKAICKGICKFFNYSYKDQTQSEQTQSEQTQPDQTQSEQTQPKPPIE
ncbi:MAG: N-acetylmuramoyl-L-alanine amidase [Oscillospiraceae bacterium]